MARRQLSCRVIGLTITGGHEAMTDGADWKVPKKDLIASLQMALQADPPELKIAAGLPGVEALVDELLSYRVEIRSETTESFGPWRERKHDDLVLSLAIAHYGARKRSIQSERRFVFADSGFGEGGLPDWFRWR